jgi:hypothetical protein
MYYNTAVMESGDLLIDIIDWAYEKLAKQVGREVQKLRQKGKEEEKLTAEQKVKKILERSPE